MEAFLVSTGIVALAEMGDKTQLLALVLAARFRKPWPIVLGIFVSTLANHALAGAAGAWLTTVLGPQVLRWILGASFIAMAAWMMVPDKLDEEGTSKAPRFGVFGTTVIAFFLAEMGDKTQVATVMLAARYDSLVATERAALDSAHRAADTTHAARPDTGQHADTTQRAPAPRAGGGPGGAAARPPADTTWKILLRQRPAPSDKIVVRMARPLAPASRFFVRVRGVRNLNGATADGGTVLTTPKPVPRDTTKAPPPRPPRP